MWREEAGPLCRFRPFATGTPAHDHLGDILVPLEAEHFQRYPVSWVAAVMESQSTGTAKAARRPGPTGPRRVFRGAASFRAGVGAAFWSDVRSCRPGRRPASGWRATPFLFAVTIKGSNITEAGDQRG